MKLNSHQFEDVYKELDIELDDLGCVMLKVDGKDIPKVKDEAVLYKSEDPKKFWVDGFSETPHLTLLYGLLKPAEEYRKQIKEVLTGWKIKTVSVEKVGYFDSPYEEEPYFCIVAYLKVTPELLEGHHRLQLLPHIDTFPEFTPHVTIAYIKKDEKTRDKVISAYDKKLAGIELRITGFDLGGEKEKDEKDKIEAKKD